MKYTIPLQFDDQEITQEEAAEKLQAFFKMANSLSHDELLVTADFMAENPEAIGTIKRWITDPPPAVKMAHKMLFRQKA